MTYRIIAQSSSNPTVSEKVLAYPLTLVARILSFASPLMIRKIISIIQPNFPEATSDEVLKWRNAVNAVSARCAGNGCLQRSLAVVLTATVSRKSVSWKAGFRTQPFMAHAWVEVGGIPIGEPEEVQSYIVTVSSPESKSTVNNLEGK